MSPFGLNFHAQLSWASAAFQTDACLRESRPVVSLCRRAEPAQENPALPKRDHTMMYLSDAEVADLCAPLSQAAAQVRYLHQR